MSSTSHHLSGIVPEGKDAQTRIVLATEVRNKRRDELEDPFWQFTAVQYAALMVMPLDRLRMIASGRYTQSGMMMFLDLKQSMGTALADLHPLVEKCRETCAAFNFC